MGFLRTVREKKKNTKHSQTAKLVYAKLLFVSSVVMRFTHEGSLRTREMLSLTHEGRRRHLKVKNNNNNNDKYYEE